MLQVGQEQDALGWCFNNSQHLPTRTPGLAWCFADISPWDGLPHNSPARQDRCYPHSTDNAAEHRAAKAVTQSLDQRWVSQDSNPGQAPAASAAAAGLAGKGRVGVRKRSEAFNGLMLLFKLSHSGQTGPLDPEPVASGAVSKRGPRGNRCTVCGPGKVGNCYLCNCAAGGQVQDSGEEGTGSAGIQ